MDRETAAAGVLSEAARGEAIDLLGRELEAARDRARAAGARPQEVIALLRERLARVRAAPTAHEPARTAAAEIIRTRKRLTARSCSAQPWWVQDFAMTAGEFIGRERELGQFSSLLDQAYARHPATVFLGGDAGVGKTCLLDKFAAQAQQDDEHVYVLRGESVNLSEGARIPYGPLVGALREFALEHRERARKLAGPGWDELGGLVADFLDDPPPPGPGDHPTTARGVYAAVQRVLRFLGNLKPVVLIFENLQWADQSTLDLVAFLTRGWRDERVVLICSHRTEPEKQHPLRARLADLRRSQQATSMTLVPFSEEELRSLLNTGGREADRDQVRRAFRLSEGNALFAGELQDSGALAEPDATDVPGSVQDLMSRELGRLSDPARRLLSVAATAARRVSYRLLAAVSTLPDEELASALRECLEHGTLVYDRPNDAYAFRHALLRETVYADEIPDVQIRWHAAMAEAISANTDLRLEEDVSSAVELAHHWFRARREPQALKASLRAARMTTHLRAFPEAETHYRHVLELWTRVDEPENLARALHERILGEAADAARWAGHVDHAVECIRAAISEVDETARPRRTGQLHERLGSFLWEAGESEESARAYADARRLLVLEPRPDATYVRVLAGLAGAESRAGHHTEAMRLALEASELATAVGARVEQSRALNAAGVASVMLGRAEEGVRLLRESLDIALRSGQLEDQFRAYGNLSFALISAAEQAAAAQVALEGLDMARKLGIDFARQAGLLANNAAAALVQLGEWDPAVELLNAALLDRPPVRQSAYLRLSRAEVDLARGDFEAVDRLLAEVADERPDDPLFVGASRACRAESALWRGHPREALETVVNALDAVGSGENTAEELRLCALGLRAAADLRWPEAAEAAVAERVAEMATRARRCAERGASLPETSALCGQCAAEHDRFGHDGTAAGWAAVAEEWERLHRPYPAAYARWRQAEALYDEDAVDEAARITRQALDVAEKLRAEPLRSVLAALGAEPVPAAVPLTERQIAVARLVARELTNAGIAKELRIVPSTVARHVSDAMEALRAHGYPVTSRMGLANYVREHGLLGEGPGD